MPRLTVPPGRTGPLETQSARAYAHTLEGSGFRAELIVLIGLTSYIEVRDLAQRHTPLIAVIKTYEDAAAFSEAYPGHGLIGRRPTTSDLNMRPVKYPAFKIGPAVRETTLAGPDG